MTKKIQFKKIGTVGAFVLPAMIPLIVFWIYPILRTVYISFTDWDYMMPEYNFVGVQNLSTFFMTADFTTHSGIQ